MVHEPRHAGEARRGRLDPRHAQRLRSAQARQPADPGRAQAARRRRRAASAHAGLGEGRGTPRHRAQQGAAGGVRRRRGARRRGGEGDRLPDAGRLLQMSVAALGKGRERVQGAGLDRALPYLLLAPSVLIVLAVLVYPLWDGLRASTQLYRYGRPIALCRPRQLLAAVERSAIPQRALGHGAVRRLRRCHRDGARARACALLPARVHAESGCCRTVLIIPMVITPVVVAIVFRLIYASDVGMITTLFDGARGQDTSKSSAIRPRPSSASWRSTSGSGRR